MNKSTATLAVCVLVGTVAVQAVAQNGNKSPVQQTAANQPAAGTATTTTSLTQVRVAVLNTNKVLKNFNKAQQLNEYISKKVGAYGAQINAKRDEIAKLNEDGKKVVNPTEAENLQKRMKQLEREMQDLDAEARKDINAQQGTIAVDIYKNVEDVVQRVAVANGFDLVIAYPDATSETDMYSQPNVVRKLASQAAIPLFAKKHIDLTDAVVTTLNQTYPVAPPAVTTAGATSPGTNGTPTSNPKK